MPYLSLKLESLAFSPIAEKARNLLSAGRLWKFRNRLEEEKQPGTGNDKLRAVPPGYAGAYVMDQNSEPQLVLWNGKEWSCECGSVQPCVHLAALLIYLAEKHPEDSRLAVFLENSGDTKPAGKTDTLFDEQGLNPQQDLLFFTEPDKVKKKPLIVLGLKKTVSAWREHHSSPLTAAGSTEKPELNFTDMKADSWCLTGGYTTIRDNGESGPLKPWAPGSPRPAGFPGGKEIGRELAALLSSADAPLTPAGEPWKFLPAVDILLRFEPLLSSMDEEPLYEAVIELKTDSLSLTGGLISAGDKLLLLDERKGISALMNNTADYLWFIQLILSRKVLSASDIRSRFCGKQPIPEGIQVEIPQLPESLKVLEPALILEISTSREFTDFSPRWRYQDLVIPPWRKGDILIGTDSRPLGLRNRTSEEELLNRAETLLLKDLSWQRGRYSRLTGNRDIPLRLEMPLGEVLAEYAEALIDEGVEIRLEDRPVKKGGSLRVQVRQNGDILELNTLVVSESGADSLNLDEWFENGGVAGTDEAYFTLREKDIQQLNFLKSHGMPENGFLSTSPDNLSLIDAVYSKIEADEETLMNLERKRSIYKSLKEFNPDNSRKPPGNFNAELRPYQTQGYAWLLYMKEKNLGCCLADDMGLGKTVQTLAYLSRLKRDGELGCSLMVGPVVTLANWEAEMRRFSPSLRYHRYSGPAGKRCLPGAGENIDLIIVSYQTLRNDIEKFLERDWDHIILDEAHYVKNSSSRTFKAVRSIKAAHRISLTGTPLENHLNELWSQMSFLNPGLLGSQSEFIRRYVKPVEKDGGREVLGRLSETVAPFILRRKKSEVLHDLPPKDETILRCDMTPDQAEAYHAARELYYRQISGLLSEEGLAGARIQIFTILSKLRLLAIHPPLAGEQFENVSSGKMAALDSLMEEILEEDHKTLVFSQFLGALDRAEETCRRHNWRFSRLTGSTRNREEPVNQFQEDPDTRVFLLSLKAGGVGINLTAADYVILLDPWWNPAVEAQAVDRAHRMGQTRPVMAYRLITSGTIEEKVLELQEKKKDLIAGVLGEGGSPKLDGNEIMALLE